MTNAENINWKTVRRLIICNEETDIHFWQMAGEYNAVSVPEGSVADTGYVDDYLVRIHEACENGCAVYFATSGKHASDINKVLSLRIGPEYCRVIDYGAGIGAASVLLEAEGDAQSLVQLLKEAKPMPVPGVSEVKDFAKTTLEYLISGYPETYELRIPGLADKWSVYLPEVTVVYGPPGSGKSNLVDNIIVDLATNYGIRSAIASMEKVKELHAVSLAKKRVQSEGGTPDEWLEAVEWLDNHVSYINAEAGVFMLEDVLRKARALVKSKGVRCLVIDNWSSMSDAPERGENEARFTARILTAATSFAKKYYCHVFFVMHPRKLSPLASNPSYYETPGLYDMLGSSMGANLTDNAIAINRKDSTGNVDIAIRKVRNQEFVGRIGIAKARFSAADGGIYLPGEHGQQYNGKRRSADIGAYIDQAMNEEGEEGYPFI